MKSIKPKHKYYGKQFFARNITAGRHTRSKSHAGKRRTPHKPPDRSPVTRTALVTQFTQEGTKLDPPRSRMRRATLRTQILVPQLVEN